MFLIETQTFFLDDFLHSQINNTNVFFHTSLAQKKNKSKHTKPQTNITLAALNIRLQMPFIFSSPADAAFQSQKLYSTLRIMWVLHLFFSVAKTNSFQGTACVKNKADGEKVLLKIRDPILQMLHD